MFNPLDFLGTQYREFFTIEWEYIFLFAIIGVFIFWWWTRKKRDYD